jgi:hypothetical protein
MNELVMKIKWWHLMLIVVLLIAPIYLINEMYKMDVGYLTLWEASDAVQYYTSFLTFIGTIFLGSVALYQNNKLMSLEKRKFDLEYKPFVTVINCKARKTLYKNVLGNSDEIYFNIDDELKEDEVFVIEMEMMNTNDTFVMVNYMFASVYNILKNDKSKIDSWAHLNEVAENPKLVLNPGEIGKFNFYCSEKKLRKFIGAKVDLWFILENKFNERYREGVSIIFASLTEKSDGEYILYTSPQDYNVKKCTES